MEDTAYQQRAYLMACDADLLAPLGRMHLAADRLRLAVVDALQLVNGTWRPHPDRPAARPPVSECDDTLAQAVRRLRIRVGAAAPPGAEQLLTWCDATAGPAVACYASMSRQTVHLARAAPAGRAFLDSPLVGPVMVATGMLLVAVEELPLRPGGRVQADLGE